MNMQPMTSRQRMLAALNLAKPDHPPCSFMLYRGLHLSSHDYLDFIQRQLDLGLDAYVQIPPRPPIVVNDHYNLHGLPVSYDEAVGIQEWVEHPSGTDTPILVKEYQTPAGKLRTEVRQTDDWRWGDHVPFLDDYLVGRSRKFLVENSQDLAALSFLLVEPKAAEIHQFKAESQPVLDFAHERQLLVAGGWGVGADLIGWVYGLQNMVFAVYDQPEFIRGLLDLIAGWNQVRMRVVLEAGVDLYIKRAWYENCDFWTPTTYQEFLYPILKSDADLAHQYGAKFGCLITSNCMPLLDFFAQAGVDVVIGIDPHQWDLVKTKASIGDEVCLWGGVNGHLTIEQDTPEEVRREVETALEILSPGGGFILSPVDNVREATTTAGENVRALIAAWRDWWAA